MSSFNMKLEAEYEIFEDQVKEELDLMCVVLEGRTRLRELTKGCNSKPYKEEPSNSERCSALEGRKYFHTSTHAEDMC